MEPIGPFVEFESFVCFWSFVDLDLWSVYIFGAFVGLDIEPFVEFDFG